MVRAVDVAILGGGPAGCSAALRIRQHAPHISVAIVDSSSHETERIAETLPPPAQELLRGLGVWDEFLAQQHVEAYGTLSSWGGGEPGGDDFIFSPFGRGWHLDRRRFDQMLLAAAEAQGVRVLRDTVFKDATQTAGSWTLELQSNDSPLRLPCSFVADSTGRRAAFATRRGSKRILDDSMVGVCGFFRCETSATRDTRLILEPVEEGWWYSTVLPGGRAAAVLMTDSDVAKDRQLTNEVRFQEARGNTVLARDRFKSSLLENSPILRPAGSGRLSELRGEAWVAIGDAACCLDPLSGQGILQAMINGTHAAYAITDSLSGDNSGLERYCLGLSTAYEQYLNTRDEFYSAEPRWPQAKFWSRRRVEVTLDPMTPVALAPHAAARSFGLAGRLIEELSATAQPAHRVVERVTKSGSVAASDRRVILTLQRLIESGVVTKLPTRPPDEPHRVFSGG